MMLGKGGGGYLVCIIAFAFIYSQLAANVLSMIGIPNLLPVARDGGLAFLAAAAVRKVSFHENRLFYASILAVIFILFINVFVSIFDNRHFAGIYYARIYLLPVLFAVACQGWLILASDEIIIRVAKLTHVLLVILMIVAIILYIITQLDEVLLSRLMGGVKLSQFPTAWFIAGGWLRMGLPTAAPNHLGLIAALSFIFFIGLKLSNFMRFINISYLGFSITSLLIGVVLALTFSRSSWLAVVFGFIALLIGCRREWKINLSHIMHIALVAFCGLVFLVILIYFVDDYNNGMISKWIALNFFGKDPSMIGHGNSFVDAWESFHKYYLWGYPRGTVGPRAQAFGGDIYNVENTFLSIVYDMGFQIGILFIIFSGFIILVMYKHASQVALIMVLFVAGMFLPYASAPEIIIFFLFIYSLLGRLMRIEKDDNLLLI
jgi:hypothetical protein